MLSVVRRRYRFSDMISDMRRRFGSISLVVLSGLYTFLGVLIIHSTVMAAPDSPSGNKTEALVNESTLLAKFGDILITQPEYQLALAQAMRKRFYHAKPPVDELAAFRSEVLQDLIDRKLMLKEVARRKVEADQSMVQPQLDIYRKRYAKSSRWKKEGPKMIASLREYLEANDKLRQLELQVRDLKGPTEAILRKYYADNVDKFTEPSRQRVSLILLTVQPSAPNAVWEAAMAEGRILVQRLRDGADFGELARLHSGDTSAQKDGDMGYLHRGMLTAQAEKAVAELEINKIADPIKMLEGIAILTVKERKSAYRRIFSDVQERARRLWLKEQGDTAWQAFKNRLREGKSVEIISPEFRSLMPKSAANLQKVILPGRYGRLVVSA